MTEEWRSIPGYEGLYEASSQGRVRSIDREIPRGKGFMSLRGRVLAHHESSRGYLQVALSKRGKPKSIEVHVLIARTFIGERPGPEIDIRHLNGNPGDCRISNLEYGTKSENSLDSVTHGTHNHARVALCSQGHLLKGRNLQTYGKMRQCRSCANARSILHPEGIKSPRFASLANQYYERHTS